MNRVLLRYELLGLIRDTRTLFLSVLLPIVLLPVLLMAVHKLGQQGSREAHKRAYNYACLPQGGSLESFLEAALEGASFHKASGEDEEEMLAKGTLDLIFRIKTQQTADPELQKALESTFPAIARLSVPQQPHRPVVEILYRNDRERSVRASLLAQEQLGEYRETLVKSYLKSQKAELGWETEKHDLSSVSERQARRYGPALSAFMVLILLGGGSVAALDSLAGERERGSLVTLFLSSLPRREILWSKFCAVALMSVATALIQMANIGLYLLLGWIEIPLSLNVSQWSGIIVLLTTLFLVEALFTTAVLLAISARCTTFQEAQLFFFPTFLVAFALSLAGLMPGLTSRSVVSLIPLAGPGTLIPEILASRIDLPMWLLQLAVHLVAARFLLKATLSYVKREEFLGGQPPMVGSALRFEQFSGRALPWFALLGAILMVVPANFATLSSLQGQAVFNQLILFGIGPWLLLKFYGQRVKDAVPLRSISPRIVLASLALIPLGQVAATGLSYLLGPLLPAPVKAMEQMMQLLNIEQTPAWQLYVMIGILPGLCEEFAFRGVLMHAWHRRFSPWLLAALVALVFGFFHLSFYRVLPTAYLGFFLGLITLATGSLLPAILVHIGNNSFAVFALLNGWTLEGLGTWTYASCFVGQLAATYLILRWGRGYPGTIWSRESVSTKP